MGLGGFPRGCSAVHGAVVGGDSDVVDRGDSLDFGVCREFEVFILFSACTAWNRKHFADDADFLSRTLKVLVPVP